MKHTVFIPIVCLALVGAVPSWGQTSASDNKVSESVTFREVPKCPGLYGIFEGRSPCGEMERAWKTPRPADCDHLKWQLILYKDPKTLLPATYTLTTELFRQRLTGPWKIIRGMKGNPSAKIYVLHSTTPDITLYLLKGSENVLFILDGNKEFLVGNQDFSYTLNRVKKVLRSPDDY